MPSLTRRALLRVTVISTVTVGAYVASPTVGLRNAVYVTAAVILVAAVWRGVVRLPTGQRGPWPIAAAGLTIGLLADVLTSLYDVFDAGGQHPTPGHLLFSVSHLLLAIAFAACVRRGKRQDQASVLDAIVVGASIGTLIWLMLAGPAWAAIGATLLGRIHVITYATTNLAIVVVVVRLILASRGRSRSVTLLIAAGSVQLAMALTSGLLITFDSYVPGTPIALGWLLVPALFAAAVKDPTATSVPLLPDAQRSLVAPHRARLLIPATLLLPITMLALSENPSDLVLAGATTLILLLIGARVRLLLTELQESRERDVAAQAERDHHRFEAIVRHTADVLLLVDQDKIAYASPSALELFGGDPTGWSVRDLTRMLYPPDRRRTLETILELLARSEGRPIRLGARLRDKHGRQQHVEVVAVDLRDDPDVGGVVITVHETTERAALEQQLRHLAFHDALTGLGNRELFQDRLTQAIARARRGKTRLALLMCDLDDFKDVNDTLGHAVGDKLLIEIAQRLQAATRESDTVVRLGGDEFAILCEDIDSTRDAVATARRLLEATREPVVIDGRHLRVGLSIGVVVDGGERSGDDLLRDADVALYTAKGEGKHRISLHRPTMTVQAHERLRLADDLGRAIAGGDIDVAFQPIIDLVDGCIVGVEALARWNHPTRGAIAPSDFIPVAEQAGLIAAIGDLVLDRTLAALGNWEQARPDLLLYGAVNLSARELREPNAVARVAGKLHRYGIAPNRLLLELTESGMLEDETLALSVMHQLRDHGLRFAVDDFGTGYSSLSYLRRLPVDFVKIDRSFIEELGVDAAADDLVRAIIDLSHTLHLQVVAEGIETAGQQRLLEAMGCRFAQGYLLGRPIDEPSMHRLLADPDTKVARAARPSRPPTPPPIRAKRLTTT